MGRKTLQLHLVLFVLKVFRNLWISSRMAAKRVSASAINWAELSKKVPDGSRLAFGALKTKNDGSLRAINSLPDALPAMNWAAYEGRVSSAILSDFKGKYEGLNVPYPADTTSASIEGQAKDAKANYDQFIADSTARIGTFKAELAKWEEMMPISEMNKEERCRPCPIWFPNTTPTTSGSGPSTRSTTRSWWPRPRQRPRGPTTPDTTRLHRRTETTFIPLVCVPQILSRFLDSVAYSSSQYIPS